MKPIVILYEREIQETDERIIICETMIKNNKDNLEKMVKKSKDELESLEKQLNWQKQRLDCYYLLTTIKNGRPAIITIEEVSVIQQIAAGCGIDIVNRPIEMLVTLKYNGKNCEDENLLNDKSNWSVHQFSNEYSYSYGGEVHNFNLATCSSRVLKLDTKLLEWEIDYEAGVDCDGDTYTYSPVHETYGYGMNNFMEVRDT